jgi:anti-anti-sigma factor
MSSIDRLGPEVQSHFSVERRGLGEAVVLALAGELDVASSAELDDAIDRAFESSASPLVVDLRELEFIDSTGLGVLVKASQRARDSERGFGLVRGGAQVQRLLDLTGLADRLTVADTPEEIVGGA